MTPFHRLLIVATLLVLPGLAQAADKAAKRTKTERAGAAGDAFVYKRVGDRELKLYVAKPPGWSAAERRPALVFFHGGGWVGGGPTQFNEHAGYFASRGLVCVQVEYRLLDAKTQEPPVVCIQDAKSAMRWVRAHAAELGIDPQRIGAAGGSAGGHLAAFVGMVEGTDDPADDVKISPRANALVLFNPVFDNGPDGGWGTARVRERYKQFSPAHNITPDDPPTVIFVGTEDKLIPMRVVERFRDAMRQAGVRCEAHFYEGQGHGFFNHGKDGSKYYYETVIEADRFLASLGWLKGAPTLRPPQ